MEARIAASRAARAAARHMTRVWPHLQSESRSRANRRVAAFRIPPV
jgi:hypothetical protein